MVKRLWISNMFLEKFGAGVKIPGPIQECVPYPDDAPEEVAKQWQLFSLVDGKTKPVSRKNLVKLANDMLKHFGNDFFDGDGFINEAQLRRLIDIVDAARK